ncbi:MAG: hypothetical protein HY812_21230 [Planctomycetes bacterium]|nr:hypothetical protein [Planctomycetota bacterium]
MKRRRNPAADTGSSEVEHALEAMSADALRELVREMLDQVDERVHGRAVNSIISRAARCGSGWVPPAVGDDEVAEVVSFAKAAERLGHADPSEVDERLRRGSGAFLRKDYAAAHRIFGALLRPIGEGEIDLGQHEMLDEVLGVDTGECAAQYVVSAYMLAAPAERAEAVRAAIAEVRSVGLFFEPLREMEHVAVELLPELEDFLPRWRRLVAQEARGERHGEWDRDEDRWLREVVSRLEGTEGLAKVARSTRRADDLRVWCESLVKAGDWKAALLAFDEAAEVVADKEYARAEFLDGAALAAQELGRTDLPARLERAWRADPNMLRLRRWLGTALRKAAVRKRAAAALAACPKEEHRQRAFLHVLMGEFEPAAKLLSAAPGLGWSDEEHAGHLLFPLFAALLCDGTAAPRPHRAALSVRRAMDLEELTLVTADEAAPRLATPEVEQLLLQAGIDGVPDVARMDVLLAMRRAAESRLTGVTEQKRRRHYGHAADLVAACVACDRSPEAARWVASLRTEHRRFPALRAELDRALGAS